MRESSATIVSALSAHRMARCPFVIPSHTAPTQDRNLTQHPPSPSSRPLSSLSSSSSANSLHIYGDDNQPPQAISHPHGLSLRTGADGRQELRGGGMGMESTAETRMLDGWALQKRFRGEGLHPSSSQQIRPATAADAWNGGSREDDGKTKRGTEGVRGVGDVCRARSPNSGGQLKFLPHNLYTEESAELSAKFPQLPQAFVESIVEACSGRMDTALMILTQRLSDHDRERERERERERQRERERERKRGVNRKDEGVGLGEGEGRTECQSRKRALETDDSMDPNMEQSLDPVMESRMNSNVSMEPAPSRTADPAPSSWPFPSSLTSGKEYPSERNPAERHLFEKQTKEIVLRRGSKAPTEESRIRAETERAQRNLIEGGTTRLCGQVLDCIRKASSIDQLKPSLERTLLDFLQAFSRQLSANLAKEHEAEQGPEQDPEPSASVSASAQASASGRDTDDRGSRKERMGGEREGEKEGKNLQKVLTKVVLTQNQTIMALKKQISSKEEEGMENHRRSEKELKRLRDLNVMLTSYVSFLSASKNNLPFNFPSQGPDGSPPGGFAGSQSFAF